jgi:hypothetical protein
MLFILLHKKKYCFIDAILSGDSTMVNITGDGVKVSYKRTYKWI